MKYLNAIYLITLLLVSSVGCGISEQEASAEIERIQSRISDIESKPAPGVDGQEAKPESAGLCQGESDKKHMFGNNLEFAKNVQACVEIDVFAMSAHLDTAKFKAKYPEMTEPCIDCFAQLTKCAADKCSNQCGPWPIGYGADSAQCELCNVSKCHEGMFKCSGVISKDIPSLRQK